MDATTRVLIGVVVLGGVLLYSMFFIPSKPEFKATIVTEEITTAVLNFTDQSEYPRYGSKDLGTVATSSIEAYLADSPGITLVQRDKLNRVLEEQRLCSQGMCDPDTAIEVGELTGAGNLIMGEIINFSYASEDTETEEMTQLYPPKFKPVPATRHEANMAAQVQIVDTSSGEIITGDVMEVSHSITVKNSEGGFSFNELVNKLLLDLSQKIARSIGAESSKTVRYDLYRSIEEKGSGWEGEPAGRVPAGDPIYAVLYFSNLKQGDKVEVSWIAPDGTEHASHSISYLRSQWAKVKFTPPKQPGRWTMELRYDGMSKPFGELIFQVMAPSTSAVPAPLLLPRGKPFEGSG